MEIHYCGVRVRKATIARNRNSRADRCYVKSYGPLNIIRIPQSPPRTLQKQMIGPLMLLPQASRRCHASCAPMRRRAWSDQLGGMRRPTTLSSDLSGLEKKLE